MKDGKPVLLDLFSGAGGCARGYQRAGFYVIGVDIKPQPRYAGDEFHQADAMIWPLDGCDVVHASPPCQRYSVMNARWGRDHPDLVAPMRQRLLASGLPYVIENVVGSPLDRYIMLCGSMFGLNVIRHRLFESNILLLSPGPCRHRGDELVFGDAKSRSETAYRDALGVPWMLARTEARQAIPPAYAEYIGRQLVGVLDRGEVAS